jgi:hypothetical protein
MAYSDDYKRTIVGRAVSLMGNARKRCKEKGIELSITQAWVEEHLFRGTCEITGLHFCFEPPDQKATRRWDAPSLDRINKDKPYTEDNTRVILWAVNCALSEYGTEIMLPILKAMIKGIESAKAQPAAPVSTGDYIPGAVGAELGSVSTPWTWQDDNHLDDNSRAIHWEDFNYRTKASGGDSVGRGGQEVGASETPESQQDNGKPPSPVIWP